MKKENMTIVRCYEKSRPHILDVQEAIKYGYEKAIILSSIGQAAPKNTPRGELYRYFPYWKKEHFEKLVEEMLKEGLLEDHPFTKEF